MGDGPIKFGEYYLIDKIATGGMAEIWRAKTVGLEGFERVVAIKFILQNYTQNPEFNTMFIDEARIASTLNHSNIVRITNFGVIENRYYHEMEFIDGRNLRQILHKCRDSGVKLPLDSACFIISEVCKGLHYVHTKHDPITNESLNIIHRDMSPQNVLISYEGEVKILDWGIAKARGKADETRAGVLKGKFGYMSPEQAEGEELDHRTDIFSTGILLYESVTGERLFVADSEVNTLKKIKEAIIPLPSKVNPEIDRDLENIVMKALARHKVERYQTCYDMYEDLVRSLHKKYPTYNSLKLSKFVKELFSNEIIADRKRVNEREQSMPSYTPFSYGGARANEEKTKLSAYSQEGTGDYSDFSASDSGPEKTLINQNEAKKTTDTLATEIVEPSSAGRGQYAEVKRPARQAEYDSQESDPSIERYVPKRKTKLIRWGLVAAAVVLIAVLFLGGNKKQVDKKIEQPIATTEQPAIEQPAPQPEQQAQEQHTPQPEQQAQTEHASQPEQVTQTEPAPQPEQQAQTQPETPPHPEPQPQPENPPVAEIKQVEETGTLSLSTTPTGADVFIDGENKGKTPLDIKNLTLGNKYQMVLRANGFEDVSKSFIIRKPDNKLTLALTQSIEPSGSYISVDVQPPVLIYVDGRLVSSFKSLYMLKVNPGAHSIEFINKKLGIEHGMVVEVAKGEHVKRTITLR